IAKEDRIIFFICHSFLVTNEKAALSKTVSRFWTIPLLRLLTLRTLPAQLNCSKSKPEGHSTGAAGLPRASRGSIFSCFF
ncbi:hypothetical protein, partial [Desulfonatronospira sp.]|uniref:hypothetical protein n=1 Tax=Desulfonatronospira sp. TaxID=1962951 RepID=UPI0025C68FCC